MKINVGDLCLYPYKKQMVECIVVRKMFDDFFIKPTTSRNRIVPKRGREKKISQYQIKRYLKLLPNN